MRSAAVMEMQNLKYVLTALLVAVLAFLAFGIPTALVETGLFKRMIPATAVDYFFLVAISLLIGAYVAFHFYKKDLGIGKAEYAMPAGLLAGILSIGCPICNAILVSLLGTAFALNVLDPARPLLGIFAVVTLSAVVYLQSKKAKCKSC